MAIGTEVKVDSLETLCCSGNPGSIWADFLEVVLCRRRVEGGIGVSCTGHEGARGMRIPGSGNNVWEQVRAHNSPRLADAAFPAELRCLPVRALPGECA